MWREQVKWKINKDIQWRFLLRHSFIRSFFYRQFSSLLFLKMEFKYTVSLVFSQLIIRRRPRADMWEDLFQRYCCRRLSEIRKKEHRNGACTPEYDRQFCILTSAKIAYHTVMSQCFFLIKHRLQLLNLALGVEPHPIIASMLPQPQFSYTLPLSFNFRKVCTIRHPQGKQQTPCSPPICLSPVPAHN